MQPILKLTNTKKHFKKHGSFFGRGAEVVKAVDGVSFEVEKGQTFGLVGESGCGKSTIAKMIVGILTPDSGAVELDCEHDIVFQDPSSSLNPRMKVKEIVGESLLVRGVSKNEIYSRVEEVLRLVRLGDASYPDKYPHQFSGGERQRIAIARSLIRKPELLVLDEPVSSLDVSIQAEIINLLKDLQDQLNLTYVFISHDLRIVEFVSDIVAVMSKGKIVEIAPSQDIFTSPKDEYTRQLLESIPKL